jgi:arylsulfatase A-like enzyme
MSRFYLLGALLGLLALSWADFSVAGAAEPKRPNVIFILIDDMGWGDLSCYGNRDLKTRHMDQLAADGIRFNQFYAAAPVCSASRAGFATGQFPARHRIHSYFSSRQENRDRGMPDFLDPAAPSVARTFQEAGYATAHFGKWHLGGGRDVGDAPIPAAYGFDESLVNFEGLGDRLLIPNDRLSDLSAKLGNGEVDWAPKQELTEAYVDRTIDFLRRHPDQPSYVHLWLCDVHDFFTPTRQQMEKFDQFASNRYLQQYYAVLDEVDRQVGRLMAALDDMGIADETIVVLASDNGPTAWPRYEQESFDAPGSTAGLRGRKWSLYEGGIRVPLIVRWPGHVPAGKVDESSIIGGVDYYPTICRLAGVAAPAEEIDGVDRSDAVLGKPSPRRAPLFWEYGREPSEIRPARPLDRSPTLAMRQGRWKLLANADGTQLELYNLNRSPQEYHNLAGARPVIADELWTTLNAWNDSLPEAPARPRAPRYGETTTAQLKRGEAVPKDQAIIVENSALRIRATIDSPGDGVIVAHGGDVSGYALYVKDGRPTFTVRNRSQATTIQAAEPLADGKPHEVAAQLGGDGLMSLEVDGQAVAEPKLAAVIMAQPGDPLEAGFDSGGVVGEYRGKFAFGGAFENVEIEARRVVTGLDQGRLATRWSGDVDPEAPLPEYPRPQLARERWLNLNGYWNYAIRPRGDLPPAPWDGRIVVPFPVESMLSGVQREVGKKNTLWYRRTFNVPDDWKGERVLLNFGAVDWQATVWVNGQRIGGHRGGYDPFSFDITDALQPDASQEIVVSVWDPTNEGPQPRGKQTDPPHGIWYTPVSGIWQTVWLEPVAAAHINSLDVVADVDQQTVRVKVHAADEANNLVVVARLNGQHDKEVRLAATGVPGEELSIKIPEVRLWSPDDPYLYDLSVELRDLKNDNQLLDQVSSYVGMRKIELAKDEAGVDRLFLNGKPLFQWGPLDQGWWPDGLYTAPTDEALRFDIEATKDLGFNMARKHVKIEPDRWYYWADKLGLLVWQDMPSAMQTGPDQNNHIRGEMPDLELNAEAKKIFRYELKEMIDTLANHPSIVAWIPFNEGWGQHDTNEILKWTKEHDPTRIVGGPSGWTDRGYGDMYDMHSYPGPDMFPVTPGRASVLGEYGGLGLPVRGHTWVSRNNWGYRSYSSAKDLEKAYVDLCRQMPALMEKGLAAAVYTQTTDVEVEVNGLMTYDRAVLKLDADNIRALHEAVINAKPPAAAAAATGGGQ